MSRKSSASSQESLPDDNENSLDPNEYLVVPTNDTENNVDEVPNLKTADEQSSSSKSTPESDDNELLVHKTSTVTNSNQSNRDDDAFIQPDHTNTNKDDNNGPKTKFDLANNFSEELLLFLSDLHISNKSKEWIDENLKEPSFLERIRDACPELSEKDYNRVMKLLTKTPANSEDSPQDVDSSSKDDVGFNNRVFPAVSVKTVVEQSVAAEKYYICQDNLSELCNSLEESKMLFFKDISAGMVIHFEKLFIYQIEVIGVLGRKEAAKKFFKEKLGSETFLQLHNHLDTSGTGLYLLFEKRPTKTQTSRMFVYFISQDDEDYKKADEHSKAIHFIRYLMVLCRNTIVLLDSEDINQLSKRRDAEKSKLRLTPYRVHEQELQAEECKAHFLTDVENISGNCFGVFGTNTSSLLAVSSFEKIREPKVTSMYSILSVSSYLQQYYPNTRIRKDGYVCLRFKLHLLRKLEPDAFQDLTNSINSYESTLSKTFDNNSPFVFNLRRSIIIHRFAKLFPFDYAMVKHLISYSRDEGCVEFPRGEYSKILDKQHRELLANKMDHAMYKDLRYFATLLLRKMLRREGFNLNTTTSFDELVNFGAIHGLFGFRESFKHVFTNSGNASNVNKVLTKAMENYYFLIPELNDGFNRIMACLDTLANDIELFDNFSKFPAFQQQKVTALVHERIKGIRKQYFDESFEKLQLYVTEKSKDAADLIIDRIEDVDDPTTPKFKLALSRKTWLPQMTQYNLHQLVTPRGVTFIDAKMKPSFNSIGCFELPTDHYLLKIYRVRENLVLIISNTPQGSNLRVLNFSSRKLHSGVQPFRMPLQMADYDNMRRTVCLLASYDETTEFHLYTFSDDFKFFENSKRLDMNSFLGGSEITHFCLQYSSKHLWFLDSSNNLRKLDTEKMNIVGKAKFSHLPEPLMTEISMLPKGQCLLAKDTKGNLYPVMTETLNVLDCLQTEVDLQILFTLNNSTFGGSLDYASNRIKLFQFSINGAESEMQLTSDHIRQRQGDDKTTVEKHWLNYFGTVYTKFPAVDILKNEEEPQNVTFVITEAQHDIENVATILGMVLKSVHDCLRETKKPIQNLKFLSVQNLFSLEHNLGVLMGFNQQHVSNIGKLVLSLISFIPVQIARCQCSEFFALNNGEPLRKDNVNDYHDLKQNVSLGLLEAIFNWWKGPVKAISSMGNQSTGKSSTLNHTTGSSFSIAATRCTDGCWMSVKAADDTLYVIMDFEGLGSFERTDQDDMLLSLFSSAISTMTIFKTGHRFDREVEQRFAKFNRGSKYLRGSDTCFQGSFMVVINDVADRDIDGIRSEFEEKIMDLIRKEKHENFVSMLYKGGFVINPFPIFDKEEYYSSIKDLLDYVQTSVPAVFSNGVYFMDTVKLLMAKLAINDFTPFNRQQIDSRIRYLRSKLTAALVYGQLVAEIPRKTEYELVVLDDLNKEYDSCKMFDISVSGSQVKVTVKDEENVLTDTSFHDFVNRFIQISVPGADNFTEWRENLETFTTENIQLRFNIVEQWIDGNTKYFKNVKNPEFDDAIKGLMDTFRDQKSQLLQKLQYCSETCERCFLLCVQIVGHHSAHSCSTNHKCPKTCEYCDDIPRPCKHPLGHGEKHICEEISHICGERCSFEEKMGCTYECQSAKNHEGDHRCGVSVHFCNKKCSQPNCNGQCRLNYESVHTVHKCAKEQCVEKCSVKSCENMCTARSHFHGSPQVASTFKTEQNLPDEPTFMSVDGSVMETNNHFCGQVHPCSFYCDFQGHCNVTTEKNFEEKIFEGQRQKFTYTYKFVQTGKRDKCLQPVPPFKKIHTGPHMCSVIDGKPHTCTETCPNCNNICEKPFRHRERGDVLHKTAHGNMVNCNWTSTKVNIEFGNRKYQVGESAVAEMCNLFCSQSGRGHSHLLYCESASAAKCNSKYNPLVDKRRHSTAKYLVNPGAMRDEIQHSAYWKAIDFEDPCTNTEIAEFDGCGFYCGSSEHGNDRSHCVLPLWHAGVTSLSQASLSHGYVVNGHAFSCTH